MSSVRERKKTPKWVWKQVAIKKKRAKSLEGMVCEDNRYGAFEVIKYHNASQVMVRMTCEDKPIMVSLKAVLNKNVKGVYTPYVNGIGYIGEGRYKSSTSGSCWGCWKRELERLPDKYHNFQVFAKDYYNGGVDYGNAE